MLGSIRPNASGCEESVEFGLVEELDACLILAGFWAIRELHWVGLAPAAAHPDLKDRMHRVEVIAHRLDRERACLHGDVAFDVLQSDPGQVPPLEEQHDVFA